MRARWLKESPKRDCPEVQGTGTPPDTLRRLEFHDNDRDINGFVDIRLMGGIARIE